MDLLRTGDERGGDYSGFVCPQCGSHYWGTIAAGGSFDKWVGSCHGFIKNKDGSISSCDFKWNRKTQDKDVMKEFTPYEREPKNNAPEELKLPKQGDEIEVSDDENMWLTKKFVILYNGFLYVERCDGSLANYKHWRWPQVEEKVYRVFLDKNGSLCSYIYEEIKDLWEDNPGEKAACEITRINGEITEVRLVKRGEG